MMTVISSMTKNRKYGEKWIRWSKANRIELYLWERVESALFNFLYRTAKGYIFPIEEAFNMLYNAKLIQNVLVYEREPNAAYFIWSLCRIITYDSIDDFVKRFKFQENSDANLLNDLDRIRMNINRYIDSCQYTKKDLEASDDPMIQTFERLLSIGILEYSRSMGYTTSEEFKSFLELRNFMDVYGNILRNQSK